MEKKIFVGNKEKNYLKNVFKCTNVMVWKALSFKSNSELAHRIRFTALQQLGGVTNWNPAEVETTHEEAERTMTQTYSDRVKLVYDRKDGSSRVLVDGREERREEGLDIPGFMALQNEVKLMAMSL